MIKDFKIKCYKYNNFNKFEIVTLQSNLFLEIFHHWNKKNDVENEIADITEQAEDKINDDLVLVMLNNDYDKALDQCINGIVINEEKYIGYTATPTMQKKEEKAKYIENSDTKCEMWFIKETKKDFIKYFENLISLGTISKFENDEICINKKVTSRIALAMSTVTKTNIKPRFCIVSNKEVNIFQDVSYYSFENNELVEHMVNNKQIKHEQHDGMGLMSPSMANTIKEELGIKHNVDYCVVRQSGLAVKGALVKFDYIDYIDRYCGGNYIIKDIYGKDVDLHEIDIIYTESQVKWARNFKNIDDYYNRLNQLNDEEKDLIGSLYITKTNKSKNKIKKYTLTNYQLLSNLCLTYEDYEKLSSKTMKYYNNIYEGCLPDIKYFFKDFCGYFEDDEGIEQDDEDRLIADEKVEYLLNLNDDFLRSSIVKERLRKNILNKVALASAGKILIKGNCKYIATSPFALIDHLVGMDRVILHKEEFYIANNANKKFTISRNPLASPWEIKNIKTVDNKIFNEYFKNFTEEVIFFNGLDYTHAQLSGSDEDGDLVACLEDDIIYNAVMSSKYLFYHVLEGDTKTMTYDNENKFKALLLSSGNLIGRLAISGGKLSNSCLFGDKKTIKENFDNNKNMLMFLTELQMVCIDAPKTLALATNEQLNYVKNGEKKPLFMKYAKGYLNPKKSYEIKNYESHYENYSAKVIEKLDEIAEKKSQGTDIIGKYIYTPDIYRNENCIKEIEELRKNYVRESQIIRKKKKLSCEITTIDGMTETITWDNPYYLDAYKNCMLKYQLLAQAIKSEYSPIIICNTLYSLDVSDKFIVNFFFDSMEAILSNIFKTQKKLRECKNGEYEFFGRNYEMVEIPLKYNNLVQRDLERLMSKRPKQTFNKEGIINIALTDNESDLLDKTFKVIRNGMSLDLINDSGEKSGYTFPDIKELDNKTKVTKYNMYDLDKITIKEIVKINPKSLTVNIAY